MAVNYTFDPRFEAYPTQKLNPDPGWKDTHQPRVLKTQFGDGYGQRAQDGLNSDPMVLDLTWTNLTAAEKDATHGFFKSRLGYQSFYWTLPDDVTALVWVCEKWDKVEVDYNIYTVTATFRQVYDF